MKYRTKFSFALMYQKRLVVIVMALLYTKIYSSLILIFFAVEFLFQFIYIKILILSNIILYSLNI
jgi:hypothetical protein